MKVRVTIMDKNNVPAKNLGPNPEAEAVCKCYADKSRFVELPTPRLPLVMDRIGTDVYCPNCGGNLSGGWPDSSPDCGYPMYQCFYCGQSLDDTKAVTREAANKALKEKGE